MLKLAHIIWTTEMVVGTYLTGGVNMAVGSTKLKNSNTKKRCIMI